MSSRLPKDFINLHAKNHEYALAKDRDRFTKRGELWKVDYRCDKGARSMVKAPCVKVQHPLDIRIYHTSIGGWKLLWLIHNHVPSTAPEQQTKYRKPTDTEKRYISNLTRNSLSDTYDSKVASKGYTTRRPRIGRHGFKKTRRLRLLSLSLQQMKRTGLWNMRLIMTAAVVSSTPTILHQSSHILTLSWRYSHRSCVQSQHLQHANDSLSWYCCNRRNIQYRLLFRICRKRSPIPRCGYGTKQRSKSSLRTTKAALKNTLSLVWKTIFENLYWDYSLDYRCAAKLMKIEK